VSKNILEVFPRRVRACALRKHCSVCFLEQISEDLILHFKVRRGTNKAKELSTLGEIILIM